MRICAVMLIVRHTNNNKPDRDQPPPFSSCRSCLARPLRRAGPRPQTLPVPQSLSTRHLPLSQRRGDFPLDHFLHACRGLLRVRVLFYRIDETQSKNDRRNDLRGIGRCGETGVSRLDSVCVGMHRVGHFYTGFSHLGVVTDVLSVKTFSRSLMFVVYQWFVRLQ